MKKLRSSGFANGVLNSYENFLSSKGDYHEKTIQISNICTVRLPVNGMWRPGDQCTGEHLIGETNRKYFQYRH